MPCGGAAVPALWADWARAWLAQVGAAPGGARAAARAMRAVSPKYVPREFMLREAYVAAGEGNFSAVDELLELFRRPYDEQPAFEARFFRRAPDGAADQGGLGFMS